MIKDDSKFNSITLLFDLPNRIHNMDKKIQTWALFSYDEDMPCMEVYNKILKAKQIRSQLKDRYVAMAKEFNSFDKKTRDSIGTIFVQKMDIKKVADLTGTALRTMYRLLDIANQKLHDAQYNAKKGEENERVI